MGALMVENDILTKSGQWKEESILEISEDEMTVRFYLSPLAKGENLGLTDIMEYIEMKGVKAGIDQNAILLMLQEERYLKPVIVASGTPAVNTEDGKFEFRFERNQDRKPRILEDGSVDYSQFEALAMVKKDELLAVYHRAERACNGFTVKGATLHGRQGKDLPAIKGKGFYTMEEKTQYYSNLDGRVEYSDGYMTVSDVLEIEGSVDNVSGDITFTGDVKIKGDVAPKMVIKAGGFITVDGHVEAAHLIAGKGVILKNGMQGSGRGVIESRGEVSGKFFESSTIRSTGSIKANVILNCDIQTDEEVIISGKKGAIVGGKTWAARQITAFYIGNNAEARTEVAVGMDKNMQLDLKDAEKTMEDLKTEVTQINQKVGALDKAVRNGVNDPRINPLKMTLLRNKILLNSKMSTAESRYRRLLTVSVNAVGAQISIKKELFPGVSVKINNSILDSFTAPFTDVTLRERGKEVVIIANE